MTRFKSALFSPAMFYNAQEINEKFFETNVPHPSIFLCISDVTIHVGPHTMGKANDIVSRREISGVTVIGSKRLIFDRVIKVYSSLETVKN